MAITLTIVNVDSLPRGAPIFYRAANRAFRIGREPPSDWLLPDPSRYISALHCEVRFENGLYWLHDRSTNGVFVGNASQRLQGPHRLDDGDTLRIGSYIIKAAIERSITDKPQESGVSAGLSRSTGIERPVANEPGAPSPGYAPTGAPGSDRFFESFCAGAGLPPELFAGMDRDEIAFEIGETVKLTVEHLGQLLKARASAKMMTRSASRTVIGAADNNPLKHIPGSVEVLEVMLARKRAGYLGAKRSLEESFSDLRRHELATYSAMQKALGKLLDQLAPEAIESKVGDSIFGSKKSRAWDLFVQRWEERSAGENGMLDAFLAYFADAYDEAASRES